MDRPPPLASDHGRLDRMFREHRGVVWRLLRCRGLSPDIAADATQEVFLVAAQRLPDIAVGKERAFLIGTALHVAQAARRTHSRLQLQEDLDVVDERTPTLDDRKSALDMVGRSCRASIRRWSRCSCSTRSPSSRRSKIADLLGIPRGTVASRLRFAAEAFREPPAAFQLKLRREQGSRGSR